MDTNDTGESRPKMPGTIIGALVVVGISTIGSVAVGYFLWYDYNSRLDHNQEASLAPAVLVLLGAAVNLALAIPTAMRYNGARIALAVLCGLAAAVALCGGLVSGLIGSTIGSVALNLGVMALLLNPKSVAYTDKRRDGN